MKKIHSGANPFDTDVDNNNKHHSCRAQANSTKIWIDTFVMLLMASEECRTLLSYSRGGRAEFTLMMLD